MTGTAVFAPGGYRYIPGPFQYSGGGVAEPGFELERVRFRRPVPIEEGFRAIEAHLSARGRPLTAFCACEMRSPAPFTEPEFRAFNQVYVGTLEGWGIYHDEDNPVARSNVCPEIDAPPAPGFEAFAYTVTRESVSAPDRPPSFIVAGSGEVPEGKASYREHIVRLGEHGPEALREKARYVLGEMERRMTLLGVSWADATATQVYTVHDIYPFLAEEIISRGAAASGLTWHYARPPVAGLDYEMDVRAVRLERVS